MFMKNLLLFSLLAISLNSFAQKENRFDSVYTKIMSIVKEWESNPEKVKNIRQKNFFGGKKINLKIQYSLNDLKIKRKSKIRYTRAGVRFEKVKILENGSKTCIIKKMNDTYLFIKLETKGLNGKGKQQIVFTEGKYLIVTNSVLNFHDRFTNKDYMIQSKQYLIKK